MHVGREVGDDRTNDVRGPVPSEGHDQWSVSGGASPTG